MDKLTLTDVCAYIQKCIEQNLVIYNNYINLYCGFIVENDKIVVTAVNTEDYKKITIKYYITGVYDECKPSNNVIIEEFSEEEWLEYQKCLLSIKRYNENKLINIVRK